MTKYTLQNDNARLYPINNKSVWSVAFFCCILTDISRLSACIESVPLWSSHGLKHDRNVIISCVIYTDKMLPFLALLKYLQILVYSGPFHFIITIFCPCKAGRLSCAQHLSHSVQENIHMVHWAAILVTHCNSLHSCSHTLCAAPHPLDHWLYSACTEHVQGHTVCIEILLAKDICEVLQCLKVRLNSPYYFLKKAICPIKQLSQQKKATMSFPTL